MARGHIRQHVTHDIGTAAHILKEARCRHLVKDDLGHRHGQRIASKGRTVRSGCHGVANRVACDDRANRKPTAKTLCHGDDIGLDAGCLIGEQRAGAANAGLYLVGDDKRAEFIGRLADTAKIVIMRVTGTTLALHRLDHHRRDMIAKRGAKLVQIAEGNMVEPVWHRTETRAIRRLVGGGKHAKCPSVKRAGGAQDGGALGLAALIGGAARHLDGGFIRLGAGIAEIDLVQPGQCGQFFSHTFLAWNAIEVRGVPQLSGLITQRGNQRRMRMTKRVHGNATCTVEIALAILGDQPAPVPTNKGQIGTAICFHHCRCRRLGYLRRGHVEIHSGGPSLHGPWSFTFPYRDRHGVTGPCHKSQTTSTSTRTAVVGFTASEGCQIRHFGQACQGVCGPVAGRRAEPVIGPHIGLISPG